MKSPGVVHSNAWTPSVSVWSGSLLNSSASVIQSRSEEIILVTVPTAAVATASDHLAASWRLSDCGHRSQWLHTGSSMRLKPAPASDRPPQQAHSAVADLGETAISAEPEPIMKPPRAEKIELAIDSLQNYEVIKPIPVLIESLGDKVFVAEAPDLNLSTSGNSVGAAFLMLKEQIAATYEGYRSKKGLDSERTRQLAVMDRYIGKTKRHWF
jgi:predicted RNase H-like HicB family nuclease